MSDIALQMADELDRLCDPYDSAIATELRRLHAENEDLKKQLHATGTEMVLRRQRDEILLLKEALRSMLYDDDQDEATSKARAALAKAQGETK